MGYTHYWRHSGELPAAGWDQFRAMALAITDRAQAQRLGLEGVQIDAEVVRFDGQCETFLVKRVGKGFDFCKTRRDGYDPAVTACLMALKECFPTMVRVSSDGYWSDWSPKGVALFQEALGRDPICPLEEVPDE